MKTRLFSLPVPAMEMDGMLISILTFTTQPREPGQQVCRIKGSITISSFL
jgi:hypothetical protein